MNQFKSIFWHELNLIKIIFGKLESNSRDVTLKLITQWFMVLKTMPGNAC